MISLKKLDKGLKGIGSSFSKMLKSSKESSKGIAIPKGTPPASMNPLTEDEWWDICRDETAPGIEHPGIPGCLDCYTMCASHPAASDPTAIATCIEKAVTQCVLPEITDLIQGFIDAINPPDTCYWDDNQFDVNTWESETCRDPIACSNECQRFCPTKGYNNGQCETVGEIYYCNCS